MPPQSTVYLPHAKIDVTSEWSVKGWALHLGVSEEKVREAVAHVGPRAEDVRRYLKKSSDASLHTPTRSHGE
jgi:Protein of unknown function (DUF3606)